MLESSRLILRGLCQSDLTERYVNWLNDPDVNRFLETRFAPQTIDTIYQYWNDHHLDTASPWFAIINKSTSSHIGNIKVGPISLFHRRADISLFIGDKDSWGQGYATEAIKLIAKWSFTELDLIKLTAGAYSSNMASQKAFLKAGFTIEGIRSNELFTSGRRDSLILLGHSRSAWIYHTKPQDLP